MLFFAADRSLYLYMPVSLTELLLKHRTRFLPVVSFNPASDILLPMDFTAANQELTDSILNDTTAFCQWVTNKLEAAGARYGIGGYNEHRTVYRMSRVFDGTGDLEPRRLHLGIDIWGAAGTPVYAPLEGTVHSFADNNRAGDYGATILVEHELEGTRFCTLYGHLNRASLNGMEKGKAIAAGQQIALFGIPDENGHWPPHLHFQVISNPGNWQGDYPGVCRFSEREQYLANCPDPDIILQMIQ